MLQVIRGWFQSSVGYIWLIVLAVYFSILAGQAMYHSYQSQQENNTLKQQLATAQLEEEKWQALLVYYQTDAYKEKVLRESLLLRMPNEQVYALPESSVGKQAEQAELAKQQPPDPRVNLPIWRQWLDYLFGSGQRAS